MSSSMAISSLITLFFFTFLALQSTTNAFDITEILSPLKQFSEYNSFLTTTGLANQINSLKSATVLVVTDDQDYYFEHVAGDVTKRILSFHVIVDYYDEPMLKSFKSKTILITLNQEVTLIVDHDSSGSVTFKAAGSGTNTAVKLVSTIESKPPGISVLQIASIIPMNGASESTAPPPSTTPPKQSPPVSPTGSMASPPRKVLAPPLTSRDKNSPTPNASPNKPRNEPPPASSSSSSSSSSTKVNNNAPSPSKAKSSNAPPSQTWSASNSTSQGPYASLSPSKSPGVASSDNGSPVALPVKPSSAPAAASADVPAPGPDQKSSAHARICYGNYLGSILVVFTTVWFIFTMN